MPNLESRLKCFVVFAASFLLGCWCAAAQGQLPTLNPGQNDGYVDINVLENQVKRNTEAIEEIQEDVAKLRQKTTNLKVLKNSTTAMPGFQFAEIPIGEAIPISIPPTITVPSVPVYSPVIWSTGANKPFSNFPPHEPPILPSVTRVETWRLPSPRKPMFGPILNPPATRILPSCRIINGRRICN